MSDYIYRCKDCGEEFDEPAVHIENHPEVEWGEEYWEVCPHCGSFNYDKIEDDEEEEE